jgi:hypothetical protein
MDVNHISLTKDEKEEQVKLLNQFLVDNWELEQLSAKLAAFNILKVLKIEKAEIRHSNVLAWLSVGDAECRYDSFGTLCS